MVRQLIADSADASLIADDSAQDKCNSRFTGDVNLEEKVMFYKQTNLRAISVFVLACVLVTAVVRATPVSAGPSGPGLYFKPNRVLIVSGIQMQDSYVIHNASDFGDVVALLKLWGVPFDIMRLDTHAMSLSDFIDGSGNAKYSVIIWTARQDQYPWQPQDHAILGQAVNNYHISLIALANKIQEPVIQGLLGLNYSGFGSISNSMVVNTAPLHFVIRGLEGTTVPSSEAFTNGGPQVTIAGANVTTLATAGSWPQLTVRTVDPNSWTKAVWIGGDPSTVFQRSPTFIRLLKRSLVWTQGYALYKDYGHSVVLRMDDPGGAQGAYLNSYLYPQLSQSTLQTSIITPLQQHGAQLAVMFNAGYPWIPTHSITHSVMVDFTDPFGTRQNIISTYAGLLDGINAGVIEVQSHGLTHMAPDLDTPIPGSTNWWNGTTAGEWAQVGWYREFFDARRGVEVDAPTQQAHLQQSSDWTLQDFGKRPLAFTPPGYLISGDRYVPGSIVNSTITITLTGAQNANYSYHAWWGASPNGPWTDLGTISTDAGGNGQAVFTHYLQGGGPGWYFNVNNLAGTQFIGGPVTLSSNYSYALRDRSQMTSQELAWFPEAVQTLQGGNVVGTYASTYVPPHIAANYTYKLAGQTGYGLAIDASSHYLGTDYMVSLPVCDSFDSAGSFARGVPAVVGFHDMDIANGPGFLADLLSSIDSNYPGAYYLSMDEWSGYMHAQLSATAPTSGTLRLGFTYDNYYARYFGTRPSTWTLHLSDETLQDMRALGTTYVVIDGIVTSTVDAATYFVETRSLTVPPGTGAHTIVFTNSRPTAVTLSSFAVHVELWSSQWLGMLGLLSGVLFVATGWWLRRHRRIPKRAS